MQKKLVLNAETIRNLSAQEFSGVVGGTTEFGNGSAQTICIDCAGAGTAGCDTQTQYKTICAVGVPA